MKNIKDRREALHLSQEDLAAKANVSRVSIARYEAGERIPSVDIAARIAAALGCRVDDLIDKKPA